MSQTVLYGGTFNPIHRGHLDICVRARQAVDARRVLLMPAAQPPHKSAGWLAPDQDRLAMCALAAREYDLIQVDDWEIRRGGRSYTVDTLGHLAAVFPEEELWLLIGTDMFLTFTQWHRWEEIGKMASLLVASREEGDRERLLDQQQRLAERGVRSRLLQNPPMPMSSTQIREELRRDGTTGKVCPQVLDYIREKELYLHPPEELDYLRRYIRPLMTDYRYRHSLGVEKQAVKMARRFGADQRKAALAGILHDVCKDMPKGALLQNILESGIINGAVPHHRPGGDEFAGDSGLSGGPDLGGPGVPRRGGDAPPLRYRPEKGHDPCPDPHGEGTDQKAKAHLPRYPGGLQRIRCDDTDHERRGLMNSEELASKIVKILDSKKGMDIAGIDIRQLTTIGDYFILVTGTSSPHVKALAEEVEDTLSKEGIEPRRIEGAQSAVWILMDYQDVILHVFTKETREFYNMERLWADAPRMDLTGLVTEE